MSCISYESFASSDSLDILVGPEQTKFTIHSQLFKALSTLLRQHVGSSDHAEMRVCWPDVSVETFTRLFEFAYTGDYTAASPVPIPRADPVLETVEEALETHEVIPEPVDEPLPEGPSEALEAEDYGSWKAKKMRIKEKKKQQQAARLAQQEQDQLSLDEKLVEEKASTDCPPQLETLWSLFTALKYDLPAPDEVVNTHEDVDHFRYHEVFLSHAQVYALAARWEIKNLMTLSLRKLHASLLVFDLVPERLEDVVALAVYCYGIGKKGNADKTDKAPLRELVCLYLASHWKGIWKDAKSREVLKGSNRLVRDVMDRLVDTLPG